MIWFQHQIKRSASDEALLNHYQEVLMTAATEQNPVAEGIKPKGYLTFKAIRTEDGDRRTYIGAMPVFNLIDQRFVVPVASAGLSPEILKLASSNGAVQRKTNPGHVQAIVDYIVDQAEKAEPWAFNSIVLYSSHELEFKGVSIGIGSAGEARASDGFSVGEGLHRCLAWAVALGLAKVKGVKRPDMSEAAEKRIELATIPAIVIEEKDLRRQKTDFHRLNQQKPLTATVLNLTDETALSELTRMLISDVHLFQDRIDLNSASVGAKSDKLLSFAQLRFVVASYLLGKRTRTTKGINDGVAEIVAERGNSVVRSELREVFTQVATRFGGLDRLHKNTLTKQTAGDLVRTLRTETLLASNAAWRALFVALHDAKSAGVDAETAIDRVKHESAIQWTRDADFFKGKLLDVDPKTNKPTGKILSSRESIDTTADALAAVMTGKATA
jgi:DGQHR domain-containing protein